MRYISRASTPATKMQVKITLRHKKLLLPCSASENSVPSVPLLTDNHNDKENKHMNAGHIVLCQHARFTHLDRDRRLTKLKARDTLRDKERDMRLKLPARDGALLPSSELLALCLGRGSGGLAMPA